MPFRPYSQNPPRLALQIAGDVLVLLWIYLWYRIGTAVHDGIVSAASVGYRIQDSAGQVAGSLDQAGRNVGNTPLVGGALSAPLQTAASQVNGIAVSGRDLGDRLTGAATAAGWLIALAPVLIVLAFWLPARWRFARRAGATAELAGSAAGRELLALRALVTRPLHELQQVAPDPLVAFRSGDAEAVRRLAALEMQAAGVRAQGRPSTPPGPPAPAGPPEPAGPEPTGPPAPAGPLPPG